MHAKRNPELEAALVAMAKPTVLGVVTARENDNVGDASLLIQNYQSEARSMGASTGTAWAMLFSAATLWVAGLVELHGVEHGQSALVSLQELALAYAGGADVNG